MGLTKSKLQPNYFTQQVEQYFDSLQTGSTLFPNYAPDVVRFEWQPWLLLTGNGSDNIKFVDSEIRKYTGYCQVKNRKHRYVKKLNMVQSTVEFFYNNSTNPIKIYEELTFNKEGQISFIEAWINTDYKVDGKLQLPSRGKDGFPEGEIKRMSLATPESEEGKELDKRKKAFYFYVMKEFIQELITNRTASNVFSLYK